MKIKLFVVFICSLIGLFIINISVPELSDTDATANLFTYGHPKMRTFKKTGIKQVFVYDRGLPVGDSTFSSSGSLLAVNYYHYDASSDVLGQFTYRDFKINRHYLAPSIYLKKYGIPVLFIIALLTLILLLYNLAKDFKKKKALNVGKNE